MDRCTEYVHVLGVALDSRTKSQELIRESNSTVTPNADSSLLIGNS
jgi:hypothetical protein